MLKVKIFRIMRHPDMKLLGKGYINIKMIE